jgi:hypothetical protein
MGKHAEIMTSKFSVFQLTKVLEQCESAGQKELRELAEEPGLLRTIHLSLIPEDGMLFGDKEELALAVLCKIPFSAGTELNLLREEGLIDAVVHVLQGSSVAVQKNACKLLGNIAQYNVLQRAAGEALGTDQPALGGDGDEQRAP